ncbi:hypothetical protein GRF29_1g662594 [Pseudopithomyces chartarum]|uniref:F-box domain-containing protein n=1 Tax=Pseudopithomyces chartarum TaxID=1892770 RepID=A0AAN6M990_9PLEO|nr:hypothetical protein GRF29_1g662594 [Pseudopithomyces chartarum]
MAKLSDLPSELFEHILADLNQTAYHALSLVSRSLYNFVIPYLYRDVDLLVRSSRHVPRVDRLFFNILDEPALGKHIRSLRIGVENHAHLHDVRRCMPKTSKAEHDRNYQKAVAFMDTWPDILDTGDSCEALESNDYGAYAALLFLLVLPTLRTVSIAENGDETLQPLKTILQKFNTEIDKENSSSLRFIEGIEEVVYNVEHETARPYRHPAQNTLWLALKLPFIKKVEVASLDCINILWNARQHSFSNLSPPPPLISLTTLILRHVTKVAETLLTILPETPQLRCLVLEACRDNSEVDVASGPAWVLLEEWNAALRVVQNTLQTLVISAEYYDSNCSFFAQPSMKQQFGGRLDLSGFDQLHTLEAPVPFITGDLSISIFMDTNFLPYAPPRLRHLILRTDMTDAQFVYPWDTSNRESGPSFQESKDESRTRNNARMDLRSILEFSLPLVNQIPCLQSFAVWQPSDPSLDFFDDQLEDLRTSCKNKNITVKVLYPMLLRWRSSLHWNLVREVTLFDARFPGSGAMARMFRTERQGLPLGLGSQYHLKEFEKHHVRGQT